MGPIETVPLEVQNEMSDLSVMRGEREQDEVVLLGPIRFANHSCSPNTKFFLGYTSSFLPHNKCVFLQVIDSIGLGEEITLSYGSNYFKAGSLKCRCPHKEKHVPLNRENLEQTTPRFQSPDVPTQLTFSSSTTSAILGSGESSSNYTASQSSIGTPIDCELSAKRNFRNQRKRRVKRRILEGSSREIRTFIHQIDATRSSEVETEETDTQVSSQCSADGTDVAERSFQFSSNRLTCNSNVTVHNASMVLFAVAARHCIPDEALFDLLKWQKIIHPHDNVPTPNFIKSETKKLTDLYVKDTEKNASGEVIFLNFAEKLKEKVGKYINEIKDYANPETETDLKLTSLFDHGTINVKLVLNID